MAYLNLGRLSFLAICLSSAFLISIPAIAAPKPSSNSKVQEPVVLGETSKKSYVLNETGAGFARKGDFKRAEESLREAVSLDSKNLSAIFNLASVLIQRDKLPEATTLLEKHAAAAETDAGLFARLGDAYFSSQKINDARLAYEKALSLDPSLPRIPAKLGTVYSMSDKLPNHLELAITQYLAAVKQEPKNTAYLSNLVNLYLVTNAADKAVSTAKRALQVEPSSKLYKSLGAAYELQKEWKNSLIAYQRAKDLGDSTDELRDKIKVLKKHTKKS